MRMIAANSHQFKNKLFISITALLWFTSRTVCDEWKHLVRHVDSRRCVYPQIYLAIDVTTTSHNGENNAFLLCKMHTVLESLLTGCHRAGQWQSCLLNRVSDARAPAGVKTHTRAGRGAGCGLLGPPDSPSLSIPLLERRTMLIAGVLTRVIWAGGVCDFMEGRQNTGWCKRACASRCTS